MLNKYTFRRDLRVLLPYPIAASGDAELAKKGSIVSEIYLLKIPKIPSVV
jgi:hypothetical protein